MDLKTQILHDCETLLCLEDFAETVVLNGRSMPAIVDRNAPQRPENAYGAVDEQYGIRSETVLITTASTMFFSTPYPGQSIEFEDDVWTVEYTNVLHGLTSITLMRNFA